MTKMPSRRQLVAHIVEGLRGEQERLEAQVRRGADERQRIGQGEDDEVVLARSLRRRNARPSSMMRRDPRIVVRTVRVVADADLLDLRVDLDGIDMARAPCFSATATSVPDPAPTMRTRSNVRSGNQR